MKRDLSKGDLLHSYHGNAFSYSRCVWNMNDKNEREGGHDVLFRCAGEMVVHNGLSAGRMGEGHTQRLRERNSTCERAREIGVGIGGKDLSVGRRHARPCRWARADGDW